MAEPTRGGPPEPPEPPAEVVALIDARNALRSRWPNVPEAELVEHSRAWAAEHGLRAWLIFDGRAPGGLLGEHPLDPRFALVGTGGELADDWIARRGAELAAAAQPYWLISSDRELRRRCSAAAQVIGGGAFLERLGIAGVRGGRRRR